MNNINNSEKNITLKKLDFTKKNLITLVSENQKIFYLIGNIDKLNIGEYKKGGFHFIFRNREKATLYTLDKTLALLHSNGNKNPKKGTHILVPRKNAEPFRINEVYTGEKAEQYIKSNDILRNYSKWSGENSLIAKVSRKIPCELTKRSSVYALIGNI